MSVFTNKVEQAAQFCEEVLAELDKTTDVEERCILLNVLSDRLNKWNLDMRLEIIRRKSLESTNTNP